MMDESVPGSPIYQWLGLDVRVVEPGKAEGGARPE